MRTRKPDPDWLRKEVVNCNTYKYPTIYVSDTHHLALADKTNNHNYVVLPNQATGGDYTSRTQQKKVSRFALQAGHVNNLPTRRTVSQAGVSRNSPSPV